MDIHNQEEVINAVKENIKIKEENNFFSEMGSHFMSLFYKYIEIKGNQNKVRYNFYHIVALSLYPNKELLFFIFEKYDGLKEHLEQIQEQYAGRLNELNSIMEETIRQLAEIKKYNLKYATSEIHDLLIKDLEAFYINKKTKDFSKVQDLLKMLKKSRKMDKPIKEQYKRLKK